MNKKKGFLLRGRLPGSHEFVMIFLPPVGPHQGKPSALFRRPPAGTHL